MPVPKGAREVGSDEAELEWITERATEERLLEPGRSDMNLLGQTGQSRFRLPLADIQDVFGQRPDGPRQ